MDALIDILCIVLLGAGIIAFTVRVTPPQKNKVGRAGTGKKEIDKDSEHKP